MRILAAMDGKLIPSGEILNEAGTLQLVQQPFGSTLYAPVEGVLAEQLAFGFVLYVAGGMRLTLALRRLSGAALAPGEVRLDPLVEPGAPLSAGQVLARLEYRTLPAAELRLICHVEGKGGYRPCHTPALLEGGRTPILQLYSAKKAAKL